MALGACSGVDIRPISPALATDSGLARSALPAPSAATGPAQSARATAGATATQSDMLLVDQNGNRRADPGDRLRYRVVISNSSGADISGLTFDEQAAYGT